MDKGHKNKVIEPELAQQAAEVFHTWRENCSDEVNTFLEAAYYAGKPTLFYAKGLGEQHPDAFEYLQRLANEQGFDLQEDRRSESKRVGQERRTKIALVLGLTSLLMYRSTSLAEPSLGLVPYSPPQTELAAYSSDAGIRIGKRSISTKDIIAGINRLEACNDSHAVSAAKAEPCIEAVPEISQRIETILTSRLDEASKTPENLKALSTIADYYSQFEPLVQLMEQLDELDFALVAAENRWSTEASILLNKVEFVTLYFDFNRAAQMHFMRGCEGQAVCTATPADSLLHELLHVYLMYRDSSHFIASANATGYPHAHEDDVIDMERSLYRQMSAQDHLPRPQRGRHVGRLVAVACPVCW